jgi:hypothetical protein
MIVIMEQTAKLAIFAILAGIGLIGLVVIETVSIQQHEVAAKGCANGSQPFFNSKGNCFHP